MGLLCSKGKDSADLIRSRLSPFGRFGRRSFQHSRYRRVCQEGSLLGCCIDVLVSSLHLQNPQALLTLPLDLAQLLLDRLVETGKLNDATVMRLQGQHFYELCLDRYPEHMKDFWVRFLVTESLEVAILSRTTVRYWVYASGFDGSCLAGIA